MNGFAITRYLPTGELDITFGEEGIVIVDMGLRTSGVSVKIRNDNSLIVCGKGGIEKVLIAHIRSNGDIDLNSNGSEAKSISSFMNDQERPILRNVMFTQANQVFSQGFIASKTRTQKPSLFIRVSIIITRILKFFRLLPSSIPSLRVLAVGDIGELVSPRLIALSGYKINGDVDQSFSNNGVNIQHSGSDLIEVAASDYNSSQGRTIVITHKHDNNLPVLRAAKFLDNGTLDGFIFYHAWLTGNNTPPWNIIPQDVMFRNGIFIVGRAFQQNVRDALIIVRIKENGSTDLNFGNNDGVGFIPVDDSRAEFNSVESDARSRIIVAGKVLNNFCLARFNPNGKFDEDFNQNEIATAHFDGIFSCAKVAKIDSVISERIVVAGEAGFQFALARYLENGSIDTTFGTNGKVLTTILSGHDSEISDIAFDNQQRIVAVGGVNLKIIID